MKRLFVVIFIFSFLLTSIFADMTSDTSINTKWRDRQDYFMKFRGNFAFAFYYYLGHRKGYSDFPHLSTISYSPLNYTESNDPAHLHHNDEYGRYVGSTWGGIELGIETEYKFIAPFLNLPKNPLLSSNKISFNILTRLTPISMAGGVEFEFTPIAFLLFNSGFKIGSGWNFAGLFNGIGLNNDSSHGGGLPQSFLGPWMCTWIGLTFQFDVAAVMPKKYKRWTHIVMKVESEFRYEAVLNIPDNASWQYEADSGENVNGWYFFMKTLIGYKIPIIEDYTGDDRTFIKMKHKRFNILAVIKLEIRKLRLSDYFDSTMKSGGWGSDFIDFRFGPIIKFECPYNFFTGLAFEFSNDKSYTDETVGNSFYQDRVYEDWYVFARRIEFFFGRDF